MRNSAADSRKVVFVLMPFDEAFDDVYFAIESACQQAGARCERVDKLISQERISDQIYKSIAEADIIVADMTTCNPNVLYEVGYAHGMKKEYVVLLVREINEVPFDLKHHPHIVYHDKIRKLTQELAKTLEHCIRTSDRDLSAIRRFFGSPAAARMPVAVVIPLYAPMSTNDFEEAKTKMVRGGDQVPVYSSIIVLDDYKAYEYINGLFASHDLGPLGLITDDAEGGPMESCVICIGGPRSNRRTRALLDRCGGLIEVADPPDTLDSYVLRVMVPGGLVCEAIG